MSLHPGTAGYAEVTAHFVANHAPFEQLHGPYLHLLPPPPARMIDVGAGAGHDAAAFAGLGYEVTAVEPTPELMAAAQALHGHRPIHWIADALPDLTAVEGPFDIVLANAVWMHLDADERRRAMARVRGLMAPGAVFALSLRHSPVPAGRRMFEVSGAETLALAAEAGLRSLVEETRGSLQPHNRAQGVTWTVLVLKAG